MLVYPKAQTKWLWIIAAYLFLAGVGGGAYLLGVAADLIGGEQWTFLSKAGIILGFPCVAIGAALLIFDLGTPKNFWRAAMKPGTSWMARGVIILSIFMILGVIHIAFWIWPFPNVLEGAEGARQILSIVGAVFALAVMIYTGLLLEASRPIAFWGAAILPELFLVSALSTGLMGVVLIGSIGGAAKTTILTFEKIYILLNVFELIALGFFMQATHRVTESRISAELVLRGAVAPLFWLGVVIVGLIVPLVLVILDVTILGGTVAPIAASICALIGGLFLREVILAGGVHAPLKAGRFEYMLTNV